MSLTLALDEREQRVLTHASSVLVTKTLQTGE